MKLSEILREAAENPALLHWLKEYRFDYYWSSVDDGEEDYSAEQLYELLMTMKDAHTNLEDFLFWFKFNFQGKDLTKCPIDSADWMKVFGEQINQTRYSNANIKDAKLILDMAGELVLEKCNIESFKLDTSFFANNITLVDCNVSCGLLSVLKCKDVKDIDTRLSDIKLAKAVDILRKHIKSNDRDIIACQTEMIDAGFEEWAKL